MTDILHITDRERAKDAMIRALESARDEMSARIEAQQWRPIETAPKDGTQYLACDGKKMWTRNQPPNCYAELMRRGVDKLRAWLRRPTKTKAAGEISRTSRPE